MADEVNFNRGTRWMRRADGMVSGILALLLVIIAVVSLPLVALAQQLPPGGTISWTIVDPEEFVTFVLFDPKSPKIALPSGLHFLPARETGMPEIEEHLKKFPAHADWAFSFIEITHEKSFLIDGKSPVMPENGGIGLWFAPVDYSELRPEIDSTAFDKIVAPSLGAVLALSIWVPDREYVSYMRTRGFPAEYALVTLAKDSTGTFHGEITLDSLSVKCSATPRGDVQVDSASGTQVLFLPGDSVTDAFVLAGSTAHNRDCDAAWSNTGAHPLARGVLLGPTYMTTYPEPLQGSAYRLRGSAKK
jgi:hypothetical protein